MVMGVMTLLLSSPLPALFPLYKCLALLSPPHPALPFFPWSPRGYFQIPEARSILCNFCHLSSVSCRESTIFVQSPPDRFCVWTFLCLSESVFEQRLTITVLSFYCYSRRFLGRPISSVRSAHFAYWMG